MKSFLLSTGRSTSRVEYYIIDLFKLHLGIFPGDIPFARNIGFNFSLDNILKKDLEKEVTNRVSQLIDKFASEFKNSVNIGVDSISMIDEKTVNITLTVNSISDNIIVEIDK